MIVSEIKILPVLVPYSYFRLSVVFEIAVFETATIDSPRFATEKKEETI